MSLKFKRNLPILLLLVVLLSFLTLAMGTQPIRTYSLAVVSPLAGQVLQPTPTLNQSNNAPLYQGYSVLKDSNSVIPSISEPDGLAQ